MQIPDTSPCRFMRLKGVDEVGGTGVSKDRRTHALKAESRQTFVSVWHTGYNAGYVGQRPE